MSGRPKPYEVDLLSMCAVCLAEDSFRVKTKGAQPAPHSMGVRCRLGQRRCRERLAGMAPNAGFEADDGLGGLPRGFINFLGMEPAVVGAARAAPSSAVPRLAMCGSLKFGKT